MPLIPKQEPPYYTTGDNPEGTKQYIALLTQTGTAAPTATILKNTLDGTPVWTRTGMGDYLCTLTDTFTNNKTTIYIQSTVQDYDVIQPSSTLATGAFSIYTYYNGDGTFSDDILSKTPITITVYP